MDSNEEAAFTLASEFHEAWQRADWTAIARALADDAELEAPDIGRCKDTAIIAYLRGRFPNPTSVVERRAAVTDNVVFRSYDVYLGHDRKVTAVDQITVRAGKIAFIACLSAEWR